MAALEVKAIGNLLGTPLSCAYAVKAGNWIFLNGHEAFDFASGIPGAHGHVDRGPMRCKQYIRLMNRALIPVHRTMQWIEISTYRFR